MSKLYKVWNKDRSVKKSLLAASLKEVMEKGREKLGYPSGEPVTVVMDWDGTEIQDEAYFQTLSTNCRLLLLRTGESWESDCLYASAPVDLTDSRSSDQTDGAVEVLDVLRKDITQIVTLQPAELQLVVDLDQTILAQSLDISAPEAARIQDRCQRFLDELQDSQEAMELLHLISDSLKHTDSPDGSIRHTPACSSPESTDSKNPAKRKRTEDA